MGNDLSSVLALDELKKSKIVRKPLQRIPIAGPWITELEINTVNDAVANAWYSNAMMYHQKFEQAFAQKHDSRYVLCLPSCTSAIHLALLALGVQTGDEVIVSDLSWTASASPITYCGAIPVFADVDPKTWCISPSSIEKKITSKTKAVVVVDLYGNMPNYTSIRKITDQYGLKLIEDAAEAIGSEIEGQLAGTFGDIGVFSFHGTKTLCTGEGGMLITDDEYLYQRAQILSDHGRKPGDRSFQHQELGYKYKMSSLQAALGYAQLQRFDQLVERKRKIFSWYKEELGDVEGLQLNPEPPSYKNSYWMSTVIWDSEFGISKQQMIQDLSKQNIDSRAFFYPLSSLPAYQKYETAQIAKHQNSASYSLSEYGINLPSAMNLTREQVKYVCDTFQSILGI